MWDTRKCCGPSPDYVSSGVIPLNSLKCRFFNHKHKIYIYKAPRDGDQPTKSPGSPIPVLDTLVWYGEKEGGRSWYQGGRTHGSNKGRCIQYAFYAKTMTNPLGILRRSALSEGTKVSTACAEILRRLKNFSVHADKDKVEDALITYMDNLIGMGYREEWRMKVIKSTLLGYERILTKVDRRESVRNREGSSTRTTRSWKRLMGPNTWFKVT